MNTVAPPSHLSGYIGVRCPTCGAKPGFSCVNSQRLKLKRCHQARISKATGRTALR